MSMEDTEEMEDSEEYEEISEDEGETDEETEDEEEVTPIQTTKEVSGVGNSVNFEYKLSELFKSIKHLDSVNIKATNEGLEFWGLDTSNTMMTSVSINKDKIRNFNFSKDLEVTTDTDYLRIVKRLYMVKAYLDDKKMIFEEGKTKFELPVYSNRANREKPKLDLKKAVTFDLSVTEVRKTLYDIMAIGGEDFSLEFKDKSAVFTARGKYGTLTKVLEPYEKGITKYEVAQDSIKVSLSLELFKNSLNGMNDRMRITIGDNSPLIIENVGYTNSYDGVESPLTEKITHFVAPRSSED